ncbi:MAG: hypothetical protein IT416_03495 [Candidatus Pacebacteria bacterium]|jgi:hypothetical protein|nr:hypothetical protein [Candidatus Paceibacterota bacterium]
MVNVENSYLPNQSKNSTNNKELIFFLVTLIGFIVVLVVYLFFFIRPNLNKNKPEEIKERPATTFYELDQDTKKIQETNTPPVETVITDLDFNNGFTSFGLILKGYADSFDETNSVLKIKNQFLKAQTLQLLSFDSSKLKEFYCWPATLDGETGPVDITTVEIGISSPTALIYNPKEKSIPIDQLSVFWQENNYVILQLETEFDITKTNFIKKLVIAGC